MADKPWKQFEREMATLLGGVRFWANSGGAVDCEGPLFLAQCKHVESLSLNALAELAKKAEHDGKKRVTQLRKDPDPRLGVVGVKTRPGSGKKSVTLVVMTANVFRELFPTGRRGHDS